MLLNIERTTEGQDKQREYIFEDFKSVGWAEPFEAQSFGVVFLSYFDITIYSLKKSKLVINRTVSEGKPQLFSAMTDNYLDF